MTKLRYIIISGILFLISACSVQVNQTNSNPATPKPENVNQVKIEPTVEASKVNETSKEAGSPTTQKPGAGENSACYGLQRGDLMVDKKQTFAIDFKPFDKSCFVTFHDPEFDNPPLGSQFFIYRNGKEVFEFPEQFGMGNTTCWVDGAAFEDLNNDELTDVIIVGKCGGKSGSYNENMVYLNNGKEFVTNSETNAETLDFSKVNQIRDFVRKNPKMFVP